MAPAITKLRLIISSSSQAKGRPLRTALPYFRHQPRCELLLGFVLACGHRARVLALGIRIAVHELYERHSGVVAVTEAGLQHAGIAAGTIGVTRADHLEQLLHLRFVA